MKSDHVQQEQEQEAAAAEDDDDDDDSEAYQVPRHHHLQPTFLSPPPHLLTPSSLLTSLPPPSFLPSSSLSTSADSSSSSLNLSRRSRGRPPGSKNKPKPQFSPSPSPSPSPSITPYLLQLPSGSDLISSLTRFSRLRGLCLCVLSTSGAVHNVTLKQPLPASSGEVETITFHGRFHLLSLSAYVTPTSHNTSNTTPFDGFAVTLAGQRGQIIGGRVVGPLLCDGPVCVVATSLNNPTYVRLPLDCLHQGGGPGHSSSTPVSNGDGNDNGNANDSGGNGAHVRMCNSNSSSSEVLWAPTPLQVRPPQLTH
ncbi:hypothetical protein vseg_019194 [Gypsophila vaccaria]